MLAMLIFQANKRLWKHLYLCIFLIAQTEERFEDSLKKAKRTLKTVENASDDDLPNRQEIAATLHSYLGNAYLEMQKNDYDKALEHFNKDLEIAKQKWVCPMHIFITQVLKKKVRLYFIGNHKLKL